MVRLFPFYLLTEISNFVIVKPSGTKFCYAEERDADLMRAYNEKIAECSFIRLPELLEKVVNSPSARYWVSEERAAIVLSAMFRGDRLEGMSRMKREMYTDLFAEAKEIRKAHPDWSIADIAFHASRRPARKFYMLATSAKVIISKIKKRWLRERRQRLRHLF